MLVQPVISSASRLAENARFDSPAILQLLHFCLQVGVLHLMDLGDKTSRYCVLDDGGEVIAERSVASTKNGMLRSFAAMKRCRIALEVGTHSPWVSRLLSKLGHEVIVANARQVKLISASSRKDDRLDAQMLG